MDSCAIASVRDEMCARIAGLVDDMKKAVRYRLLALRSGLTDLESSRAFLRVPSRIREYAQRTDDAVYALESSLGAALKAVRARYGALAFRLSEADLRRGLVERRGSLAEVGGRLNTSARVMLNTRGERVSLVRVRLSKGEMDCTKN